MHQATSAAYVQYRGGEYDLADIERRVRSAWAAAGHRRAGIYRLRLYVKPEENAVYYVINNREHGVLPLA